MPVRRQLIAIAIGATSCLVYGVTGGFGFGLPPYSFVYAVAVGLIAGVVTYGVLSTKTAWRQWATLGVIGMLVVGMSVASKPSGKGSTARGDTDSTADVVA
jgi:hypothetical protein